MSVGGWLGSVRVFARGVAVMVEHEIFRKSAESPIGKCARVEYAPAHELLAFLREEVVTRLKGGELKIDHVVDVFIDALSAAVVTDAAAPTGRCPSSVEVSQYTQSAVLMLSATCTEVILHIQCLIGMMKLLGEKKGDGKQPGK